MSRMSSSFLSQGELVIGQAVTPYLSHMRSRKEKLSTGGRGKALGIAAFVSSNGWIRFRDRLFTVLELALEIRVLGCI
ncbi:hypothetical protein P8452_29783 [Trifolium repens]|nr:hypothetical protein P8452_29783 [Trifolium repens]